MKPKKNISKNLVETITPLLHGLFLIISQFSLFSVSKYSLEGREISLLLEAMTCKIDFFASFV